MASNEHDGCLERSTTSMIPLPRRIQISTICDMYFGPPAHTWQNHGSGKLPVGWPCLRTGGFPVPWLSQGAISICVLLYVENLKTAVGIPPAQLPSSITWQRQSRSTATAQPAADPTPPTAPDRQPTTTGAYIPPLKLRMLVWKLWRSALVPKSPWQPRTFGGFFVCSDVRAQKRGKTQGFGPKKSVAETKTWSNPWFFYRNQRFVET